MRGDIEMTRVLPPLLTLLLALTFAPPALSTSQRPTSIAVAAAVATCMSEGRQHMIVVQGSPEWASLSEDHDTFAQLYPSPEGGIASRGPEQDDPTKDADYERARQRAFEQCFTVEYPRLKEAKY